MIILNIDIYYSGGYGKFFTIGTLLLPLNFKWMRIEVKKSRKMIEKSFKIKFKERVILIK